MSKQAYYFSHDSNARNDEKILALRMKLGMEGYGIFWAILEKMRDNSDYMCIKDYNMIAFDLRVASDKIKSTVEDFGLFQFTDDGKRFYSESFNNRMEIKESISQKRSDAAKKRWSKDTDNEQDNANAMQMDSKSKALKESKGKESKEDIYIHAYTEEKFLKRWKDARMHYDKKPTNIKKLKFNDAQLFKNLLQDYKPKDFDQAISGLFFQKTYPQTRVQPTHLLENFEQYLDCWKNNEKLFEKKQTKKDRL